MYQTFLCLVISMSSVVILCPTTIIWILNFNFHYAHNVHAVSNNYCSTGMTLWHFHKWCTCGMANSLLRRDEWRNNNYYFTNSCPSFETTANWKEEVISILYMYIHNNIHNNISVDVYIPTKNKIRCVNSRLSAIAYFENSLTLSKRKKKN